MKKRIYNTFSDFETRKLGREFAQNLIPKDVVCLVGPLGSGKTTFTKGIAEGLGVKSRVISPTFVVVRTHEASNKKGIKKMYHLDLFRLESEDQVKVIDFKDFLDDKSGIVIIEWPEVAKKLIKGKMWNVSFEQPDQRERKIVVAYG